MLYEDELFDPVIERMLEDAKNCEPGSPERAREVKNAVDLANIREVRRKNEEARIDKEHENFVESKRAEEAKAEAEAKRALEEKKIKHEFIGLIIKGSLEAAGIAFGFYRDQSDKNLAREVIKLEHNYGNVVGNVQKRAIDNGVFARR